MTDQAPKLLREAIAKIIVGDIYDGANVGRAHQRIRERGLCKADEILALTRPTPTERPVPHVREALDRMTVAQIICCDGKCILADTDGGCILNDPVHDDALKRADKILTLTTARPSDAAVAWRSDLDEIQLLINGYDRNNSDWGFRSRVISEIISKLRLAFPPDEPARESGLTIEHRLQAVRATAIEECAQIAGRFYDVDFPARADAIDVGKLVCGQVADAIRALEPARVTPSTVGGEAIRTTGDSIESLSLLADAVWQAREDWADSFGGPHEATYKRALENALWNDKGGIALALRELVDRRKAASPTIASEKECGKAEIELLRNQLAKAQAALRDIGKDGPIWRAQRIAREALVPPAASLNAKETP